MYMNENECKYFLHVGSALGIGDSSIRHIEMFVRRVLEQKKPISKMLCEIFNNYLEPNEQIYAIYYFGKMCERRYHEVV